ncbi:MAG: serine/threonine-protein kinase [Prevotella sp.]|nr:serine/threonine-protein kinase [Prevotella sp.]
MEKKHLANGALLQGGKYKIVRLLNGDGFGSTYEALYTKYDSRFVIKEFFIDEYCSRDESTGRVSVAVQSKASLVDKLRKNFIDEAKAIVKMRHANIFLVVDVFEENGTAYYATDFIEGGKSLHDMVKTQGLSEKVALKYIRQVADALRCVHSFNRLHLDIKPENIIVDANDNAILINFGASKHYDDETGENTSPLSGINSKGYAPVEQLNASFKELSRATDIYALGATLYTLLTGITPPDADILASGVDTLQPMPETVSQATRNAVDAAMQLRRNDRPQSIDEFLKILDNGGIVEPPKPPVPPEPHRPKPPVTHEEKREVKVNKSPVKIVALIAAFIVLVICIIFARHDWGKEKPEIAKEEVEDTDTVLNKEDQIEEKLVSENNIPSALVSEDGTEESKPVYNSEETLQKKEGTKEKSSESNYNSQSSTENLSDFEKLKQNAEQGDAVAQNRLGVKYEEGAGVSRNYTEAVKWYQKSAEQGNMYAQYNLGVCYYRGKGVSQNYSEAFKWFQKSAEQGYASAQNYIGYMYDHGEGVSQDYSEAIKWYQKSAEQGNASAQYNLGYIYAHGEGVSQDYTEALKWYQKAGEQGNASAQNYIGYMYAHGEGVSQDYTEAIKWYQKSAEQGNASAQNNLGYMYEHGNGVTQNYAEAIKWYQKAAEKGNAAAQCNLGDMYENGYGVTKDKAEAINWYKKAAEKGDEYSKKALKRLGE